MARRRPGDKQLTEPMMVDLNELISSYIEEGVIYIEAIIGTFGILCFPNGFQIFRNSIKCAMDGHF